MVNEKIDEYKQGVMELGQLQGNLSEIEKALANVNNIEVTSGGIGDEDTGKDVYSALATDILIST